MLPFGRMHAIIGFLGPSGAGKTTLMFEMIRRHPDRYGLVTSLTTRPSRGPDDDRVFRRASHGEIKRMKEAGELFQISEYAGNLYANDRASVDTLLAEKIGMMAIVEMGIRHFRVAGYHVIVVRVVPEGNVTPPVDRPAPDTIRKQEDAERASQEMPADLTVVNSFANGGKEKAIEDLERFLAGID